MTKRELWRTAYHEAAHAIAHVVTKAKLTRVTIAADGSTGLTHGAPWRGPSAFDAAVRSLAGPVAEARISRRPLAEVLKQNPVDQQRAAIRCRDAGIAFDQAVAETTRLLAQHWDAVWHVAHVLADEGNIDGERVQAIIDLYAEVSRRCSLGV